MVATRSATTTAPSDDAPPDKATAPTTKKSPSAAKSNTTTTPPKAEKSTPARKRKTPASPTQQKTARKRTKKSPSPPDQETKLATSPSATEPELSQGAASKDEKPISANKIYINRSPVLHLWAASVARFLHPSLPWQPTCLSAGAAVSTICAVAKGRSIGTIKRKDPEQKKLEKERKKKRKEEEAGEEEEDEVDVMQFHLRLRSGLALVSSADSKGKPGSEEALRAKFGEAYEEVRRVFEEVLGSWKGSEDELNRRAFHFYEEFRPTMAGGQKGWGRKGELDLEKVRTVAAKGGG